MMAYSNSSKRKKRDSSGEKNKYDSDSDSDCEHRSDLQERYPEAYPRFLVVEGADAECPLSKLSPFAIRKWMEGIHSTLGPNNVKVIRKGEAFLIDSPSSRVSKLVLGRDGSNCVDTPVKVSIHKTLNSSKGVLRSKDLSNETEADILRELKSQGVSKVHRLIVKKNGQELKTNTYFLDFRLPSVPEHVFIGFRRERVQKYIPSPMRCYNCQKFGHTAKGCDATKVCGTCGESHETEECTSPVKCVNCSGPHPANSKDCPRWKLEAEIQKVRTEQNISWPEARKVVTSKQNVSNGGNESLNYAQTVRRGVGESNPVGSSLESTVIALLEAVKTLTAKVESLEREVKNLKSNTSPEVGETVAPHGESEGHAPESRKAASGENIEMPVPTGRGRQKEPGKKSSNSCSKEQERRSDAKLSAKPAKQPAKPAKQPETSADKERRARSTSRSASRSQALDWFDGPEEMEVSNKHGARSPIKHI